MVSIHATLWTEQVKRNETTRRECWRIRQHLLSIPLPVVPTYYAHTLRDALAEYAWPDQPSRYTLLPGYLDYTPPYVPDSITEGNYDDASAVYPSSWRTHADTVPARGEYIPPLPPDETYAYDDSAAPYADGPRCKDTVTCRDLFVGTVRDIDTFNRAYALHYVTHALTNGQFLPKASADKPVGGNARTRSDGPASKLDKKERKSGGHMPVRKSNRHSGESNVEDVVQNAFLQFWQARQRGTALNTRYACRAALADWYRSQIKQKRATMAFLRKQLSKEYLANRAEMIRELELDQPALVQSVRAEGNTKHWHVARALGCHRNYVAAKLAQLGE